MGLRRGSKGVRIFIVMDVKSISISIRVRRVFVYRDELVQRLSKALQ